MSTTHGATTSAVPTAEKTTFGVLGSGWKVWKISGKGWNEASSGCGGAVWGARMYRSNNDSDSGECLKEPTISVTLRGTDALGVGGREAGGRATFSSKVAFPELATRNGCMPSSSVCASWNRRKV